MQKLYVLIDKETNKVRRHTSKGNLGVFVDENQLNRHAWRYGARGDNTAVWVYQGAELLGTMEVE